MDDGLARYAIGLVPLGLLAVAAAVLTVRRGVVERRNPVLTRLLVVYGAAIAVQTLHFFEERFTGFPEAFPDLLGFGPWSDAFYTGFNVVWIVVWIAAGFGVAAGWRVAYFPVWFLALAACANGIAHPLIAIATGGYFPGLWTALVLGVIGVVLLRMLVRETHPLRPRAAGEARRLREGD